MTIFVGVSLDLTSKHATFAHLAPASKATDPAPLAAATSAGSATLAGGVLKLRAELNHGAVFGLGSGQQQFFIAFTIAALTLGVIVFMRRTTTQSHLAHFAIGLAMAGAIGNFHDRLRFGAVRDFIQLLPDRHLPAGYTWPGTQNYEAFPWVFNLADLMLLIGLGMVLLHLHRQRANLQRQTDCLPSTSGACAS